MPLIFYLSFYDIDLAVMQMDRHVPAHKGGQRTSCRSYFFLSTLLDLGFKFRSPVMTASTLSYWNVSLTLTPFISTEIFCSFIFFSKNILHIWVSKNPAFKLQWLNAYDFMKKIVVSFNLYSLHILTLLLWN